MLGVWIAVCQVYPKVCSAVLVIVVYSAKTKTNSYNTSLLASSLAVAVKLLRQGCKYGLQFVGYALGFMVEFLFILFLSTLLASNNQPEKFKDIAYPNTLSSKKQTFKD